MGSDTLNQLETKMATKKKTVTKKAPVKKRKYVRKAPAKKTTTKAVTKRKYTRRKPVELKETIDGLVAQAADVINDQIEKDLCNTDSFMEFADMNQEGPSKPEVRLEDINVIDLRGISAVARLALASMLSDKGYITTSVEDLLNAKNLLVIMETDALVMLHANKLVNSAKWDDVKDDRRISRMGVSMNVEFDFSEPDSSHPNTMEVDGVLYARIR